VTGTLPALLEGFLADEYDASPLTASSLGLTRYDGRLPDLSAGAWQRRGEREDGWLERFLALDEAEMADPEDRADRDLVVAFLRGRAAVRGFADWRRNPDHYTGPGLNGVFGLFLHRLRPDAELVHDAAARLRAVPDLLAEGRANLDPELASPLLVRRALGQARGGVTYAREQVARSVADPGLARELAEAGARTAAAYEEFVPFLEDLAERATGDWALGEERYDALLRQREGLPYGARELRERGQAEYDGLAAQMRELTREIAGHDDWRRLVDELNTDAPADPEQMRREYDEATGRARDFLVSTGLVTLPPGERCAVDPAPEFLRSVLAVAFYISPPPFGGRPPVGHFFVPFPPADATPEQVEARLRSNSRFGIPTTAVHEAYPGHHWHLAHVAATQRRPVRSVLWTSYFVEGWALYAEQLLREAGFFTDPRHVLGQVEARLFRAARIVVDTSLHLGEMPVEDAVEFLATRTALTADTARAEVARYCAWPTQAPSYLTGALEIGRMAREWVGRGGQLPDFHDRLAGSGGLPIGVAERLLRSDGVSGPGAAAAGAAPSPAP